MEPLMVLKITQRNEADVPMPNAQGRVNEDLQSMKAEMTKLPSGMVLEVETGSGKAIRSTKMLVSKAAKELGTQWEHWHVETKVYAKPRAAARRGRKPKVS